MFMYICACLYCVLCVHMYVHIYTFIRVRLCESMCIYIYIYIPPLYFLLFISVLESLLESFPSLLLKPLPFLNPLLPSFLNPFRS
jgi:hypothetical protein